MCGRFALYRGLEEIKEAFQVQQVSADLEPSYNIAPTQDVAVVVQRPEGVSLEKMRWGLIPFWAKDPGIGSKMINARSETVHEKPSFKRPLKNRRCLVVADGFYEWQKVDGTKIPTFIRLKSQRPFGLAGLYDVWKPPDGEAITSCTIITTDANPFLQPIHNRMPVILPPDAYTQWIDPAIRTPDSLQMFIKPYPAEEMAAHPVSTLVNNPKNDHAECVVPA